ncbi:hypothetical protein N9H95_02310 [Gammaproteobacteria bacterium]|nr:hypothetical protein [Gammaproteobacteria bacterium]
MKRNIIITAILIIGVSGYNYWINTPQYSLLQIQKSVDTKDRFLFDKYVDTNGIIEEVVEDLSKIFIEEMDTQESSEYSFFDPQVLAAGFVSLFQPAIENAIEEGFDEFWEDEVETVESKSDLKNNLDSFEVSYLKRDGKMAKLGLEGEDLDSGETIKIEFKLIKIENYWRITQISNLEDMLRQNMDQLEELIDLDT